MSAALERTAEAARLLAAAGIEARVTSAGAAGEIAAIHASPDLLAAVAEHAAALRALGFRYVALELESSPTADAG